MEDANAIGPGVSVVLIMNNGLRKLGTWVSSDANFITIDYKGERQLIPLASVDTIKRADAK